MRPLDEAQTKTLFDKLAQYCGASLKDLIAPIDDSGDRFVFRLQVCAPKMSQRKSIDRLLTPLPQKQKVYYVRLSIANLAVSVARDKLLSLGISVGKFTKSGKFKVAVTFLPVLAEVSRLFVPRVALLRHSR
jgi:60S ribosome subunit biogenesis protein NIP7